MSQPEITYFTTLLTPDSVAGFAVNQRNLAGLRFTVDALRHVGTDGRMPTDGELLPVDSIDEMVAVLDEGLQQADTRSDNRGDLPIGPARDISGYVTLFQSNDRNQELAARAREIAVRSQVEAVPRSWPVLPYWARAVGGMVVPGMVATYLNGCEARSRQSAEQAQANRDAMDSGRWDMQTGFLTAQGLQAVIRLIDLTDFQGQRAQQLQPPRPE